MPIGLPAELPLSALASSLECGICISLVCEPVTTPCGHTFCRPCLAAALQRSRKRCPACRAVCHANAWHAAESVMLAEVARSWFPEQYAAQLLEVQQERTQHREQTFPIFFYNQVRSDSQALDRRAGGRMRGRRTDSKMDGARQRDERSSPAAARSFGLG